VLVDRTLCDIYDGRCIPDVDDAIGVQVRPVLAEPTQRLS
jgi:hypothetical protein